MGSAAILPLPIGGSPPEPEAPKGLVERVGHTLSSAIKAERASAIHAVPVALGLGAALYFALPVEPPIAAIFALLFLCGVGAAARSMRRFWFCGLALIVLGFALAQVHTRLKAQPLMSVQQPARTYIATVLGIERRVEGGWRLVLQDPQVPGEALRLPKRVRITVRTDRPVSLKTGQRIRVRAVLMPLPRPILPGGYDFGRALYFKGLGGTGFAVSQVTVLGSAALQAKQGIAEQARERVRVAISRVLAGDTRGVALALLTGDRSGLSADTRDAYRSAGLAHLLAISGLHMALIAAAVFFAVRRGLTLWPRLALVLPLKPLAAAVTILALFGYLALVGAPVSAQRATMMAGVAMLAIIVGRDALSMRTAALAATVLLVLAPHVLLDIGFQMSFTAVIALIAGYEASARRMAEWRASKQWLFSGPALYMAGVFLSTILAEVALTPLTLYHFNEVTLYGLAGNALAVPLTGFWIMPAGLIGLILLPFGLADPAFWMMGQGIDLMTAVATDIAEKPYALMPLRRLSDVSHLILLAGFLWVCLLQTRLRLIGFALIVPAIMLADPGPKPGIMISQSGRAIAVKTPDKQLVLIAGRTNSFASDVWARSMGQADLKNASDTFSHCDGSGCVVKFEPGALEGEFAAIASDGASLSRLETLELDILRHPSGWRDACENAEIVIVQFASQRRCKNPTITLTQSWLAAYGPVLISLQSKQYSTSIQRTETDSYATFIGAPSAIGLLHRDAPHEGQVQGWIIKTTPTHSRPWHPASSTQ